MQSNALFYRSVVALDSNVHAATRVASPEQNLAFARDSHLIPAIIDEFSAAAHRIPILFAGSGKQLTPVFLVGRRAGENAFIDENGAWASGYVPAYIRRYPFMIGEVDDRPSIVCFDEQSELINGENGVALFEASKPTPFLEEKIQFLDQYLNGARRTERFCAMLEEYDLLSPADINFQNQSGSTSSLYGLMVVNEERLNALSDNDFNKLRAENVIVLIYAHLFSLRSMDAIKER